MERESRPTVSEDEPRRCEGCGTEFYVETNFKQHRCADYAPRPNGFMSEQQFLNADYASVGGVDSWMKAGTIRDHGSTLGPGGGEGGPWRRAS